MKNLFLLILFIFTYSLQAQVQKGLASYYDDKFEGRKTSSGEIFKQSEATAAHKSLEFGTMVKVTNLKNNKQVVVRINDRGPFIRGRIIDLSKSVANELGFLGDGVTEVEIEVVSSSEVNKELANTKKPTDVSPEEVPQKNEEKEVVESTLKDVNKKAKNVQQASQQTTAQTKNKNENSVSEFFSIETKSIQPDFFGVQIGSFREMVNLMRFSAALKTAYKEHITVQSKSIENDRVYTIILGKFANREMAERFQKKVANTYEGAFIVDMTK